MGCVDSLCGMYAKYFISHPHVVPDDHIDLAVAYGLDLDARSIILDQHNSCGRIQARCPSHSSMRSRDVLGQQRSDSRAPSARSTTAGRSQMKIGSPVRAMLAVLRAASEQVSVVVIGSCPDVAAVDNTDPSLSRTVGAWSFRWRCLGPGVRGKQTSHSIRWHLSASCPRDCRSAGYRASTAAGGKRAPVPPSFTSSRPSSFPMTPRTA